MSWSDGGQPDARVRPRSAIRGGLLGIVVAALGPLSGASAQSEPRFLMACVPCHGYDGIGYNDATPNLAGRGRDYLFNQLTAFRSGARSHPLMIFFSGQMTQEEMGEIIDYYARLPAPR